MANRSTKKRRVKGEYQLAALAALGYIVVILLLDSGNLISWIQALVFFSLVFIALPFFILRARRLDWFHPFAFPLVYVALVLLVPMLYVFVTRRPVWILLPDHITVKLVVGVLVALVGLFVGVALGLRGEVGEDAEPAGIDWSRVQSIALVFMVALLVIELGLFFTTGGSFYRGETVGYTTSNLFSATVNALVLPATALLVVSSARIRGRILYGPGLLVVVLLAVILLVAGTRNEVIAQMLFLLWAQHTMVRRIHLMRLIIATVVLLLLVAVVQATRIGLAAPTTFEDFGRALVADLTGPVAITSEVMERVPEQVGYYYGATYLTAAAHLPPGPLSRAVFGEPNTGTFVFRDIIGLDDPNFGIGFSMLAEAYLNFSWFGLLLIPGLVGFLFGWSSRFSSPYATRALHLLYPMLLALLPMAFRSDALFQFKSVAYAMILTAVVFKLARQAPAEEPAAPPGLRGVVRFRRPGSQSPF